MQDTFGHDHLSNTYEALRWHLRRWNIRLRIARTLIWLPRGLIIGVLIALTAGIAAWLRPLFLMSELVRVSILSVGLSGLLTLAIVWLWPRPAPKAARDFDQRFDLKQRLTTALELSTGRLQAPDYMAHRQLEDARLAANSVVPRRELPLQARWPEVILLLLVLGGLILSLVLDNPQMRTVAARQQFNEERQAQLEALDDLEESIRNNPELSEEERETLTEPLDQARETLNQEDISPEEAVAALNEAEQELRRISEGLSAEERRANSQAGNDLSRNPLTDELGETLGDSDLPDAANEAEELGDDLSDLNPAEQQEVADQLEEAAETLSETNPELAEDLQEAADDLREDDTEGAQNALDEAAETMRQQVAENQNNPTSQAAEELANELAEGRRQMTNQPQDSSSQPGTTAQQPGQQNGQGEGETGESVPQETDGEQGSEGQPGEQGGPQSQDGQPSEGGQGTGQQPSEQGGPSAQSDAQGGESGGSGAGDSGTQDSGNNQSPTSGDRSGDSSNRPGDEDQREFDEVYDPTRIGGEDGEEVDIRGQIDDTSGEPLDEGDFNEEFEGEARVPYNEVFRQYEQSAREALESEYIPIGVRDVIRSYFSSLEP